MIIKEKDRKKLGVKISLIGLFINLILFSAKLFVGFLSRSVAVTADAVNNLSDFGSAVILWVSFNISSRPADREHPFGHARFEYIASTIVSMVIVIAGFQLGQLSVQKIIQPELVETSILFYSVFALSTLAKTFLYFIYSKNGKDLESPLLITTAKDSLSDIFSTLALGLAMLIGDIYKKPIDGYAGLLVSIFILHTGVSILFKTSNRLLGVKVNVDLRNEIKDFIRAFPGVYGVHDLIIHDYGVENYFASAHVEVNAAKDIREIHELIDHIEREISLKFKINMVIHMDPIDPNDSQKKKVSEEVKQCLKEICDHISMHDLRVVESLDHKKLIFDLKIYDACTLTNAEVRKKITDAMQQFDSQYICYIDIDRNYEVDTVKIPFNPTEPQK